MRNKRLAFLTILLLSFSGIQIAFFNTRTVRPVLEFLFFVSITLMFLISINNFRKRIIPYKNILLLFLGYSFFIVIYSCFVAKSYEQWRYLLTIFLPTLLLTGYCFLASLPNTMFVMINTILRYSIPLSFVFFLFGLMNKNENVHYVVFVSFIYILIIFIPLLRLKWKIVILVMSFISLMFNLNNRSNIISIVASFTFMLFYFFILKMRYSRNLTILRILKTLRLILLFLPILLLFLGSYGVLNVFKYMNDNEKLTIKSGNATVNMTTDSRTFIYEDTFKNLNKKNSWFFGVSATDISKTNLSHLYEGFEKGRLGGSESGFLNFLSFGGVFYVLIVFMLLFKSTYLAIFRSKNTLIKIVGLFLSFRWFYLFIENPLALNFYWVSLFLAIGMCLSPEFRSMNNKEIKRYFEKI